MCDPSSATPASKSHCGWTRVRVVHLYITKVLPFMEDYVWYGLWATLLLNTVICPGSIVTK